MTNEIQGSRWIVVNSRVELFGLFGAEHPAAAPDRASLLSTLASKFDPRDRCIDRCLEGSLLQLERNRPLGLLVSPDQHIRSVRFPVTGRIARYANDGEKAVRFAIFGSPLEYEVPQAQHDLVKVLVDAHEKRTSILVLDPTLEGRPVLIQHFARPADQQPCLERLELNASAVSLVERAHADDAYGQVFAMDCVSPYTSGIPFRFCRGYCHTTAAAVADALAAKGILVGKVWAFARPGALISIETTSNKQCRQKWWYHVAVAVRSSVKDAGGYLVFDPISNLKGGVLTLKEWQTHLGRGLGRVHFSSSNAYRLVCDTPSCDTAHPCFESALEGESDEELKIARCSLGCLAESQGDPPFRCTGAH